MSTSTLELIKLNTPELNEAQQKMLVAYVEDGLIEAHDSGVEIGMGRAKTAITVGWNTGSTDLHGLRKVLDDEIEWWQKNPTPLNKRSIRQ